MRTRAAIAFEVAKPLVIDEVDLDGPRAGEVLVEVKATGVCHTDDFTRSGADPGFETWATTIGAHTLALVRAILLERPHPEHGLRSCRGLKSLTRRYENARIEAACERALTAGARSYTHVESILKCGLDQQPLVAPAQSDAVPPSLDHENIRGADYYIALGDRLGAHPNLSGFLPSGDSRRVPEPPQRELFPPGSAPQDAIAINARCQVKTQNGHRVVIVAGMPIAHYAVGDAMAEAHAMVSLIEQGWADQIEVAHGFGRDERSVRRYQRRFEDGGLAALGRPGGYPLGRPRTDRARARLVMGRTGARWSLAGAEAVLRLRALRSSGDFDDYWLFHLAKEHERNHLSRYADGVVPDPIPTPRGHLRIVK